MKILYKYMILTVLISILFISVAYQVDAFTPGSKVSESSVAGNKHNLSAMAWKDGLYNENNPNPYKATNDPINNPRGQQICVFCHTPHSANVAEQAPLWNRAFSTVTNFQRFTSGNLDIRGIAAAQYGTGAQPNGSSKLCLSCHDGVSSLGAVYTGAPITMVAEHDVISGLASFNPSTNKMLKGHHPVSFVYLTGFTYSSTPQTGTRITGLKSSFRFLPISSNYTVKLQDTKRDGNGWVQCTTCHNPHQNQSDEGACYTDLGGVVPCDATNTRKVAPFWVYHGTNTTASQDMGTVCKVCHGSETFTPPAPWPYPNP